MAPASGGELRILVWEGLVEVGYGGERVGVGAVGRRGFATVAVQVLVRVAEALDRGVAK